MNSLHLASCENNVGMHILVPGENVSNQGFREPLSSQSLAGPELIDFTPPGFVLLWDVSFPKLSPYLSKLLLIIGRKRPARVIAYSQVDLHIIIYSQARLQAIGPSSIV